MFKNNLKKIILLSILTSGIFLLVFSVEAAVPPPSPSSIDNPLSSNSFTELAGKIIKWVVKIGEALAVLMIIYGGFLYMFSAGKEDEITKAKKTLIYALVGLLILLIGDGFIYILKELLGTK